MCGWHKPLIQNGPCIRHIISEPPFMPPAPCAGSNIFYIANRGLTPPGYHMPPAQARVLIFGGQSPRKCVAYSTATTRAFRRGRQRMQSFASPCGVSRGTCHLSIVTCNSYIYKLLFVVFLEMPNFYMPERLRVYYCSSTAVFAPSERNCSMMDALYFSVSGCSPLRWRAAF